ncbi:MAG: hypothetical protein K5894_15705 [Lachnospiraceae bacterium]|nr:hypothetical protein [Lachnospiraceae bacterium]
MFNENNFIFWTDGGLGNCLLGLGSAYELAVRSGCTADVIWDWRKKNLFGTLYGDMTREKLRKISDEYFSSENLLKSFMKKNGLS